jgi:hypothetical protein
MYALATSDKAKQQFKSFDMNCTDSTLNPQDACNLGAPNDTTTSSHRLRVRSLEIIPQQSSLNVNEYHATTSNYSFLGILKLISGFGFKTDFQRQREAYDKFLQQKAFASGFGKGSNAFGWTFGPLPGSKRIEPGQRTTYAVLAVPRKTVAMVLEATTRTFKRGQSPEDGGQKSTQFLMLVPGEKTERFWIDGVSYNPVVKGKQATVIINGRFFSPQLGVLVNGTPLAKALSITRSQSEEPPLALNRQAVAGEYELVNSRRIVLNFSMGNDFVGTPIITIVAPERSDPINFWPLNINRQFTRESLQDHSVREPMFIEAFDVNSKLEPLELPKDPKYASFAMARLSGKGLQRNAAISVNGVALDVFPDKATSDQIKRDQADEHKPKKTLDEYAREFEDQKLQACPPKPFAIQESSQSYRIFFEGAASNRSVLYRQRTPQGLEERAFKDEVEPVFAKMLVHFQPGARPGDEAHADLSFKIPEKVTDDKPVAFSLHNPQDATACSKGEKDNETKAFRVRCRIPSAGGGSDRDFFSVKVVSIDGDGKPVTRFADFPLPVQPRGTSLRNIRNNKPTGFANEDATAVIQGVNLQGITAVLFGEKEAQILATSGTSITVKVPKAEVPRGQESAVPVLLKTASGSVSAGIYLYLGEPQPRVVVSGYPYPSPPGW